MSSEAVLDTRGLAIGYGETVLLKGIDLRLVPGTLTALLGPNGIGKSTLLRTMAGSQPPLAGTVHVSGKELRTMSMRDRARMIALVTTARPDLRMLDVASLVGLGRYPWTGRWGTFHARDVRAVEEAMGRAGLLALRDRPLNACSDGERQKAMIARALAQEAPLMLLDEPTAFLDVTNRAAIVRLLRAHAVSAGGAVLFSTHDLQLALDLSHTLVLLRAGEGVWQGTPEEAVASGELQRVFAGAGVSFDPSGMHRYDR